jgi:signal transduction histidine kinase
MIGSGSVARVLHIEDDPKSRLLVKKLLASAGHTVIEAESGLEGIRKARSERPDLVLVDINVPDLDGYEITLRLRGMPSMSGVPIVAITAEGDRMTSLAVGADGFIAKPLDATRFAQLVDRYLLGHREHADETGEIRLRERSQKIVERLEKKVGELIEANRRLEEQSRLRREFLRNLSHELATPMTPVVGYLKLLLGGELGALSDIQKKCLTSVEQSTHRLRSLVDTLLDVSQLETGRLHFFHVPYDFIGIAQRALQEVAARFDEQGVQLSVEPCRDTNFPGHGDADKLLRAMVHVLDNAAKFTPRGGQVAVALRRGMLPGGGEWYGLSVADSGPGVAPEQIPKILQPFYQVDGSVTRSHGGVGLGLAFARRVCEAMGGGIDIQSPPSEAIAGRVLGGTCVTLRVPPGGNNAPPPPPW